MQTELKPEVVLCPNCKEEVPKTLYCLNCGYPLYKMDVLEKAKEEEPKEEPEEVIIEVAPEPFSLEPLRELAEIAPIEVELEEPEVVEDAPVEMTEIQAEVIPTDLALVIDEVTDIEHVAKEDVTVEDVVEHAVKAFQLEPEPVEEVVEVVEEAAEVVEVEEVPVVDEPEPEIEEVVEEPFVEVVAEAEPSFEPDPVIREVMETFAKNIAMKIRLVKLLKDGEVKLETFSRLFESYAARGELLMNSRNEMLERVKFDLDNMERGLNEARIGLEELKIRMSIRDASDEEYNAKAPGFEWDIQKYQVDVEKSRAEIKFLGDLNMVISEDEISELRNLGREGLDSLEDLTYSGAINPEIAHRIKVTLDEALSCLSNTCVG
ncbi:zinc ribbon domain-containing protein [Candidatus Bathyarchaeota archaeon]|nr:zinc ribbon domain-containing protein [Candidatus Bathyarchaeota archaeon]MBL7168183.1 zinc ribbon domain-containing protein [Candidatus Bathyarchaeota archaeon]